MSRKACSCSRREDEWSAVCNFGLCRRARVGLLVRYYLLPAFPPLMGDGRPDLASRLSLKISCMSRHESDAQRILFLLLRGQAAGQPGTRGIPGCRGFFAGENDDFFRWMVRCRLTLLGLISSQRRERCIGSTTHDDSM